MSQTATCGNSSNNVQLFPLSRDSTIPISVPAQRILGLSGLTYKQKVATSGKPLLLLLLLPKPEISTQVCPRLVVLSILGESANENKTYAVLSWVGWDAMLVRPPSVAPE